jgi:hypothetical protein
MSPARALSVPLLAALLFFATAPAHAQGAADATPPPAASTSANGARILDDFETLDGWSIETSPGARLEIAQDSGYKGRGMRMDFEFQSGVGYVIARKTFNMRLPENFAFHLQTRGEAPRGDAEFKLVDRNQSVWWLKRRDFNFPRDWEPLTVKKRHLSLAWGTGEALDALTTIEFALSPGAPGKGSVWIDELIFEPRPPLQAYTLQPQISASTTGDGSTPGAAIDPDPASVWHSGTLAEDQWLLLDFLQAREYGGLIIDWDRDDYAINYRVEASADGETWKTVHTVRDGNGQRDYIALPNAESRYLRLSLERSSRQRGYGIRHLTVQSYEFSSTPATFFEAIARAAPRGYYPRYFQGEQTYWTVVGADGDDREALLNEDGMLEVDKGAFSIEPFLFADDRLLTWADGPNHQELADGYLPIPTVRWQRDPFRLSITTFAAGAPDKSVLYARYRLENRSDAIRHVSLFLALRPFQVNPPWQSLNLVGGVAPIRTLVYANREITSAPLGKRITVLTEPVRFRAATFDQGAITDYLVEGRLPAREAVDDDEFGRASGVLEYGWDLQPGEVRDVYLRIPFHASAAQSAVLPDAEAAAMVERLLEQTRQGWTARLDRVGLELPPAAQRIARSIKSNLAYILINRDGPAIQPGSRAYSRSWIRDGALTSAALLGMGYTEEVRQFLQWYAPYQFADGKVPCCVDARGADPVAEHDSHGELIYTLMEYYRYTRDVGFLREMWPHVLRTVDYIDALRQQRLTDDYRQRDDCAYCGLVPESISHEGYASQPRHSYWDNFFTLRGLKDAAAMAAILGEDAQATRMAGLRDAFRRDLYHSILTTLRLRGIDYIPGAVELGDFDPPATAIALDPGGELGQLPQPALNRTFERYAEFFRQRRDGGLEWVAYAPYEWRTVGAMVRLGQRQQALEQLAFFFEGQRPAAWNQWAEVVWREPRTPRFLGDMPHTWVGSDFIRAARSLFVYERESDQALVIGAGLPANWVTAPGGVAVKRMPTWHGTLNYRMALSGADTLRVDLSGDVVVPPGGIVLHSPLERPLRAVRVNGQPWTGFTPDTATLDRFPAQVELLY